MGHTGTYTSIYTGEQFEAALDVPTNIIAEAYNTAESYVLNDIVIYSGVLYQCKSAATGTWDSTKWDVIKAFDNENYTIFDSEEAVIPDIPVVPGGGTATGIQVEVYRQAEQNAIKEDLIDSGVFTAQELTNAKMINISGTTPGTVQLDVQFVGEAGNNIKLVHQLSSGEWEVLYTGVIPDDYIITVTLTEFSPIVGTVTGHEDTIHFTQQTDITNNFSTYLPSGASITIQSGTYAYFNCTKTDKVPHMWRNYTTEFPKEIEVYYKITGSRPSFVTNQFNIGLSNSKSVTFYHAHYASGWQSYLPFPSYTNHRLVAYNGTVYYSNTSLPYGNTMYKIKFVNSGSNIKFYLDDALLCTIPIDDGTYIKSLTLNPCSGWWQTRYKGWVDYVKETY